MSGVVVEQEWTSAPARASFGHMTYDVAIVGGGVAGAALAAVLGRAGRRVALLERDWARRETIVGELLQPGGAETLAAIGLRHCLDGIDAQPVRGFAVVLGETTQALPYPKDSAGRPRLGASLQHADFVAQLRQAALVETRVDGIEGTATTLVKEGDRAAGVAYSDRKGARREVRARLTVLADGRNSRLRAQAGIKRQPHRLSYSVGVLLERRCLPAPQHGNVFLTHPAPMLGYQISSDNTRVLVDVPGELPSTQGGQLRRHLSALAAQLPLCMRAAFSQSVASHSRFRVMPNLSLCAAPPRQSGVVVVGDALNMRHPLTGSGMTVALNDARLLAESLEEHSLANVWQLETSLQRYYRSRRALAATVDMLSGALYEIFRAEQPDLQRLRRAVMRYWRFGGPAVRGPMALLSGVSPRPAMLLMHYLAVALVGVGQSLLEPREGPLPSIPELRSASGLARAAARTMTAEIKRLL